MEQVAAGERVIISRAGQPIADLVPHQRGVLLGLGRDFVRDAGD